MSGTDVAYAIFSDRYSSLKLTSALLTQVLLFTIFWDIQSKFDPLGLSIMIISAVVMIYRLLKIMVYHDLNKKRERLHLFGTLVLFAISIYIAIS